MNGQREPRGDLDHLLRVPLPVVGSEQEVPGLGGQRGEEGVVALEGSHPLELVCLDLAHPEQVPEAADDHPVRRPGPRPGELRMDQEHGAALPLILLEEPLPDDVALFRDELGFVVFGGVVGLQIEGPVADDPVGDAVSLVEGVEAVRLDHVPPSQSLRLGEPAVVLAALDEEVLPLL